MAEFRENIDQWLRQSEPDYYLFFLKAWIPFNAWYVAELPQLKRRDSDIIKELQDNVNSKPRKIIENYLTNSTNYESLKFQSHFAELIHFLEKIPLTHNGRRLSFKAISLTENPEKFKKYLDEQDNVYKVERTTSYFQAYIEEKGGKVLLDYKHPVYALEDLSRDSDYIRLKPTKIQNKIYNLFQEIDPRKPISIISNSTNKKEFILLKSENQCKVINDSETVAKGCIRVLYNLRCMLFHGEVSPINTNKPIYEHAFYILRLIIKELH
jgi:hypothetical protein